MSLPNFQPFILMTPSLLLIPTPLAITTRSYRALYASVHADPAFCAMGFGEHFPPRQWNDAEARDWMNTRDVLRCWGPRGMGDFAMGLLPEKDKVGNIGRRVDGQGNEVKGGVMILEGRDFEGWLGRRIGGLETIKWVGYAGIRDATTTSMPERVEGDEVIPGWLEMVELRYGVSPVFWGRGLARLGAEAVMLWGVKERGVERYIAETEKENVRSGKVLQKMGFVAINEGVEGYWKEETENEWALTAKALLQSLDQK